VGTLADDRRPVRRPAVAGTWYPGTAAALRAAVDAHLSAATPEVHEPPPVAIVAPHAGLMYSGPVAGWAYRAVRGHGYACVVLVGPSHFIGFEGVAIVARGDFDTPLGPAPIAADVADAVMAASPLIRPYPAAHAREHSLEMQLPFLRRVLPDAPIVPLVMGFQQRGTIEELAGALARALAGTAALLVASTDLSHYFDRARAAALDARVIECVRRFDPDALLAEFERYPEDQRGRYVACGGGPLISVMAAARDLGARRTDVLKYADSGDISGETEAVVGYLAAAMRRG